jgi:O-antigen/teichoic acid export membrane protein
MKGYSVNNKRIAKNTLYLYLRMLFVMAISLYTVRAILDILGVVDYGIYNVVGAVVTMFAFMNRTLSTSSQRYFSIELVRGDKERLSKWFCLNISSFIFIGLIVALFLETAGLWFLNTQMTIPEERLTAANVVYQLSILSFLFHIVSVPYLALIIVHEKMNVFAYVGIIEALGRLAIVFILMMLTFDKLIIYGILILLLSVGVSMSYIIYCWRQYSESKFRWYWNTAEVKELLGFSGWHFLGTFSMSCRSQGINILLNLFFNPAVNAARAIAFQVNAHVDQLSSNFFTAIKPQIYKSYAKQEFEDLFQLMMRGTIISTYLVSIIAFPFIAGTSYILGLWLKDVPDYAIIFTQLTLINGLIDATNGPLAAAALATGRIRNYELILSTIYIANIPISYLALKSGIEPTIVFMISIILSFFAMVARSYILKGMMDFPWLKYIYLVMKVLIVSLCIITGIKYLCSTVEDFLGLISHSVLILLMTTLLYSMIIEKKDRRYIYQFIKNKVHAFLCHIR